MQNIKRELAFMRAKIGEDIHVVICTWNHASHMVHVNNGRVVVEVTNVTLLYSIMRSVMVKRLSH